MSIATPSLTVNDPLSPRRYYRGLGRSRPPGAPRDVISRAIMEIRLDSPGSLKHGKMLRLGSITMLENVRVRFAPSPTGEPHVGNLRTALFNWLFARRHGGKFIVRVEDTDQERTAEGALRAILQALKWLELDWDEGPEVGGPYNPYFQSQRLEVYQKIAQDLIERDAAYHCFCSRERLDTMRRGQERKKLTPRYDGSCRGLTPEERRGHITNGSAHVIRFKMPRSGETSVRDLIRGEVTWQNDLLDDFILLKSDGYPTYHLANVVDDHIMEISHVLRAEEWLSSTPKHLQIYRALEYDPPYFGHLPMILGPDRAKLSKRHGANSILEYEEAGFLSEAMVNFMALLGWSLDDKTDIISRDVLIGQFSLERVGKAGAIFDQEKLLWMNGTYIRQLGQEELAKKLLPYLERDLGRDIGGIDIEYLRRIVPLLQERLKNLGEAKEMASYFFSDGIAYDPAQLVQKGMDSNNTIRALGSSLERLIALKSFDASSLEETLLSEVNDSGLSGRQLFGTLRVAVTGRDATPPLFDTMEVLGRRRCLERIEAAAARLKDSL